MSKEVCITTFLGTGNYGSTLQAYALSKILQREGCDVSFLGKFNVKSYIIRHPRLLFARIVNKLNKGKNKAFFSPVHLSALKQQPDACPARSHF